ncbi:thiamine metabolism- protein [Blastocladiella emersonii ATCC 22665]|nr:thiamine metabolism- protein [Blastocladiella emersonii ATCC 22665]
MTLTTFAADKLPYDAVNFEPIRESDVSREMTRRYMTSLLDAADTDVVIVGAGPAGLMCAYELSKDPSIKVSVIEASVAPGGGAWLGGQLMTPMVVRKPAHLVLDELDVPYDDCGHYVVVSHAALLTATLIARIVRNGVKLFNATAVEDFIVKSGVVVGVATNWALVTKAHGTQNCMDPQTVLAKVIVSSCGHDGPHGATGIKRLHELGMVDSVPGMKALHMEAAEDAIVANTREIVPGMIITGMEVSEACGTNRMGATFGAMIMSGRKAGYLAREKVLAMRVAEASSAPVAAKKAAAAPVATSAKNAVRA